MRCYFYSILIRKIPFFGKPFHSPIDVLFPLPAQGGVRLGLCCPGLKRKARICVLDEVTTTSTSITTAAPVTIGGLGVLCGSRKSGAWASVACDMDQQLRCTQGVVTKVKVTGKIRHAKDQ